MTLSAVVIELISPLLLNPPFSIGIPPEDFFEDVGAMADREREGAEASKALHSQAQEDEQQPEELSSYVRALPRPLSVRDAHLI